MPRNYHRKTAKANWRKSELLAALQAIEEGSSVSRAAEVFGIPRTTLITRRKRGSAEDPKLGRFSVFSDNEERELAEHLVTLARLFYGLTPLEVRRLAFEFAERNSLSHNFNCTNKTAGKDCLKGFLCRNKNVSVRKPEPTSLSRIYGMNRFDVDRFFNNLKELYDQNHYDAGQIFNMDETGFTSVPPSSKILAPKGQKQVGIAVSAERGRTVTFVCCFSAMGMYVSPMIIFPRVHMNSQLMRGAPAGSIGESAKSGWINKELFLKWMKHFIRHVRPSQDNRFC